MNAFSTGNDSLIVNIINAIEHSVKNRENMKFQGIVENMDGHPFLNFKK
jgi:hypothetical protein